jgi:hypothetical protein
MYEKILVDLVEICVQKGRIWDAGMLGSGIVGKDIAFCSTCYFFSVNFSLEYVVFVPSGPLLAPLLSVDLRRISGCRPWDPLDCRTRSPGIPQSKIRFAISQVFSN